MEASVKNIDIWCWKYLENTRNYPGLHLTAKDEACDILLELIDKIAKEGDGRTRTIPLKPLSKEDEAKVSGGQKFESFQKLKISWHVPLENLHNAAFIIEHNNVHFHLTENFVGEIKKGLLDIKKGTGDYSIHPQFKGRKKDKTVGELDKQSEDLWFWPCFGHYCVVE